MTTSALLPHMRPNKVLERKDNGDGTFTQRSTIPVHIKAATDNEGSRSFKAIVAVYNNLDSVGDVVRYGAFAEKLKEFDPDDDSKRTMPFVWSHQIRDAWAFFGSAKEVVELDRGDSRLPDKLKDLGGLYVAGDVDNDPYALKVFKLLKGRRVTEFSFTYSILKYAHVTDTEEFGVPYWELQQLDPWEVGPTLRGANPMTHLIGTSGKAAATEPPVIASLESAQIEPTTKQDDEQPAKPARNDESINARYALAKARLDLATLSKEYA